jgi:septal ring-binding cell division protein DamX
MEERYQKELFEDLDKLKKSASKNENLVPKTKFSLTLSLEKTVFTSIAIVMVMVVVYAVGIERGKVIQRQSPQQITVRTIKSVTVGGPKAEQPSQPQPAPAVDLKVQIADKKVPAPAPAVPAAQVKVQAPAPASQAVQAVIPGETQQAQPARQALISVQALPLSAQPKPYTIVGATFTRKDWADKEVEKLKKSGQDAAVYQSANYFLVCIGSYQTKDEAKAALTKIRNAYKDAYLRSR